MKKCQEELSFSNFVEPLTLLYVLIQLDQSQQSNPQDNCKTFSKLKKKHLPKRKMKYNRKMLEYYGEYYGEQSMRAFTQHHEL